MTTAITHYLQNAHLPIKERSAEESKLLQLKDWCIQMDRPQQLIPMFGNQNQQPEIPMSGSQNPQPEIPMSGCLNHLQLQI